MQYFLTKFTWLFLAVLVGACSSSKGTRSANSLTVAGIDKELAVAADQYKILMSHLEPNRFPRNYDPQKKTFQTSGSEWWCSGFYPGTLLYLYEQTRDAALYGEAMRIMKVLEKEKLNTRTHDLGFMMCCSFGNSNRHAPKKEYDDILMTSAKS